MSPTFRSLFELAVEVQTLEHQLDGAGDLGRIALAAELLDRGRESRDLGRLADVFRALERVADFDLQAVVEVRQQIVEFMQREVAVEDGEHCLLQELFDDLLFVATVSSSILPPVLRTSATRAEMRGATCFSGSRIARRS